MTKGKAHYKQNIIDDAWVTVVTSTNTAMMEYPYVLGHPKECSPTLASMADTYIMDSKIGDESVQNEDVIRRAKDIDADVVTPADVLHDPKTTTERILDLFIQLDDLSYNPEILIPLQPNPDIGAIHTDHYHAVNDVLSDHGFEIHDHRLSVGGIKDWEATRQLKTIVSVRNTAGHEQFLHGLGFGASHDWISVLRQYPSLVDSIDMTSVIRDVVQSGKLFTPQADRVNYRLPRGKNSTVLSVMYRESVLYMISYLLGPHPRDEDVPSEITNEELVAILEQYNQPTDSVSAFADVATSNT